MHTTRDIAHQLGAERHLAIAHGARIVHVGELRARLVLDAIVRTGFTGARAITTRAYLGSAPRATVTRVLDGIGARQQWTL